MLIVRPYKLIAVTLIYCTINLCIHGIYNIVTLRFVLSGIRSSNSLTAGRVEVFHDRTWGTICSNGFDRTDAEVLCRLLTGTSRVLAHGTVGSDNLEYVLANYILVLAVRCCFYTFCWIPPSFPHV